MTGSEPPATRWELHHTPESWQAYADHFAELHASGDDLYGEARFVDALCHRGAVVLDGGCGTGRVTEGLVDRGLAAIGVDKDAGLVDQARARRPDLTWVVADLLTVTAADLGHEAFDLIVLAGNVMVFLAPGTERAVLANLRSLVAPGGRIVTGFNTPASQSPRGNHYAPGDLDADCAALGLTVDARYRTWQMDPWRDDADWAVTVIGVPS